MENFIEKFGEFLEAVNGENMTVKKTVPMKKEWKAKFKEIETLANSLKESTDKLKAMKKAFWAEIELSTNEFSDMRYNEETDEIEILEPKDEKGGKSKGILSPIQFKK